MKRARQYNHVVEAVIGQVLQAFFVQTPVGHVARHDGGRDDPAVGIAHRRDRQRNEDPAAALAESHGLEVVE